MFLARQEAPEPAHGALRSLRPSMNSPVVVVDDLPAGPATAVLACLAGPAGPRVALAIRSQRSGQVVFFGPDEELRERDAADEAFDAALTFAERLGFLFEDDRFAEAPAEARRLWESLLEAGSRLRRQTAVERPRAAAGPPVLTEEELWLEEIAAPGPAVGRTIPLTKFRTAAAAPARPAARSAVRAPGPPPARLPAGSARRSS